MDEEEKDAEAFQIPDYSEVSWKKEIPCKESAFYAGFGFEKRDQKDRDDPVKQGLPRHSPGW